MQLVPPYIRYTELEQSWNVMMIICHITCNFKSIFNKAERIPNKIILEDEGKLM